MATFGANGDPDVGFESRSIAWAVDGLYVMANMWWEPVDFTVQVPGDWRVIIDTTSDVVGATICGEACLVAELPVTRGRRAVFDLGMLVVIAG